MANKSVGDSDLKGKKFFIRADLNVPLDDNQNITDDTRIRAVIPTIKHDLLLLCNSSLCNEGSKWLGN